MIGLANKGLGRIFQGKNLECKKHKRGSTEKTAPREGGLTVPTKFLARFRRACLGRDTQMVATLSYLASSYPLLR